MSKPNEQVFTGTSNQGSLQDALDAAVSQVGHGQAWRLASIDGLVGGIAGNDVNVRIFAVTQAAGGTDGGTGDQEQAFEVPTSRTGRVVDISGQISICQDGAQYELVERGEQRLRLKVTNPDAERVLAAAAGTTQEVTVSGYIRHVECERMDVYDAAPAGSGVPHETRQGTVEEILKGTVSFCQDGAEYELVTHTADGEERLRLRAAHGRAGSVLKRYAGTGQEVSVTGPVSHVECTVMDVVEAQPVRATADSTHG
ncbi:MAG TPA: hypothetical protein VEQ60_09850 [Longimicrobium sp.]|nr:hypothetical protein [Longimicrobium sp.]